MSIQILWLTGIVLAAFGLLACFLPSGSCSDAASPALNALAGGPFRSSYAIGEGRKKRFPDLFPVLRERFPVSESRHSLF
jgi:hypothetical protein